MERLKKIYDKDERLVIGLMSGTSVDGIDTALIRIKGKGENTKTQLLQFENYPYSKEIRDRIFRLFNPDTSSVVEICHMNFLLGEIFADASLKIIKKAGLKNGDVDLIGSHGQTIYHMPNPIDDSGYTIKSTLQIGEAAVIAERTGIITVSDFRVRDMAAGGQGAPLVPYTEYLLYREENKTVALQNIGGIANVTLLPKNGSPKDIMAFDNGPGNMVIDEVTRRVSNGKMGYDKDGILAKSGTINNDLLKKLLNDEYFHRMPPKTTGREYFGTAYVDKLIDLACMMNVKGNDLIATVTALTAKSIAKSYEDFIMQKYKIDKVIVGGGGSYNKTLLNMIKGYLHGVQVITQEDMGLNSDAKEAIAFAILANETINGNYNNIPNATGAKHPVIMGKISF